MSEAPYPDPNRRATLNEIPVVGKAAKFARAVKDEVTRVLRATGQPVPADAQALAKLLHGYDRAIETDGEFYDLRESTPAETPLGKIAESVRPIVERVLGGGGHAPAESAGVLPVKNATPPTSFKNGSITAELVQAWLPQQPIILTSTLSDSPSVLSSDVDLSAAAQSADVAVSVADVPDGTLEPSEPAFSATRAVRGNDDPRNATAAVPARRKPGRPSKAELEARAAAEEAVAEKRREAMRERMRQKLEAMGVDDAKPASDEPLA